MSSINGIRVPIKLKPMTAHKSKYPQGNFKDKNCKWCEEVFTPIAPSHHYCSVDCRKDSYSEKHYQRKYGVSVRWVRQKLDEQDWKCAICREVGFKMREDHVSGLNLDHNHDTGKARALLCHNCNRGLGLFQDNPAYLRNAAIYIEAHSDAG